MFINIIERYFAAENDDYERFADADNDNDDNVDDDVALGTYVTNNVASVADDREFGARSIHLAHRSTV